VHQAALDLGRLEQVGDQAVEAVDVPLDHPELSPNLVGHVVALEFYNTQGRHSALGGLPPTSRL